VGVGPSGRGVRGGGGRWGSGRRGGGWARRRATGGRVLSQARPWPALTAEPGRENGKLGPVRRPGSTLTSTVSLLGACPGAGAYAPWTSDGRLRDDRRDPAFVAGSGPPVDRDLGAARWRRVRRQQVRDDAGDLGRFHPTLVVGVRHRCAIGGRVDHARQDHVAAHAIVLVLDGDGLGEGDHSSLGRDVASGAWEWLQRCASADTRDRPASGFDHGR
jgi:hypothetical protein